MASIDDARNRDLTVVLTGAESAGKTTLAKALARHFDAPWVEEYARAYLEGRPEYAAVDLLAIARGQAGAEARVEATNRLLFADTDLLVVKVWSEVRFGRCDPEIETCLEAVLSAARARLYLIPRPDIPWAADPLREHPHARMGIHARHLELLESLRLDYVELTGPPELRLTRAIESIDARLRVSG